MMCSRMRRKQSKSLENITAVSEAVKVARRKTMGSTSFQQKDASSREYMFVLWWTKMRHLKNGTGREKTPDNAASAIRTRRQQFRSS